MDNRSFNRQEGFRRPDGMPPYDNGAPYGASRPPYDGYGRYDGRHRVPYTPPVQGGNGMGIAGFVLAVISLFGPWLPVAGGVTWLLGLIFSIIGVTRRPRGLAVAGLVISIVSLVLFVVVMLFMGALLFTSSEFLDI